MTKVPFNLDSGYGKMGRVSRAPSSVQPEKRDGRVMRAIRPKLFILGALTLAFAIFRLMHSV